MEVHNFVYNYGFLADWLRANPSVKRGDLLRSMEMCDYGTLAKWTNGETMMPLAQMMKFCNLWGVPITAFFMDEKADEGSVFTPINTDAQVEPTGGWPDSSRKAGIKVCDPRTAIHMNSNIPDYVRTAKAREQTPADKPKESPVTTETADVGANERMRYLDMIEKLNDRVMELSRQNIMLENELAKLKSNRQGHYDIAAEPMP